MNDGKSPQPIPRSLPIAERLLSLAEKRSDLRAHLIERWARAASWSRLEGIALAWTIDPGSFKAKTWREETVARELPEEARHYFELVRRDPDLGNLYNRIPPSRFMSWAQGVGLEFHPDWERAASWPRADGSRLPQAKSDRERKRLVTAWACSPYWSPEEGAVLAYDLDPENAIEHSVTGYDETRLRAPAEARQLLSFARRAIEVGTLDTRSAPVQFMTWARSMGVEFHSDWRDAVADEAVPAENEPEPPMPAPPVVELKTREQESHLKMVAGMAMGFYGWGPEQLRSPATSEIAKDLKEAGVPLDTETIRKWLRKGYELVDRSAR